MNSLGQEQLKNQIKISDLSKANQSQPQVNESLDIFQYDIDQEKFIDLLSSFTGINKNKLNKFLDHNPINTIFEHPSSLDITGSQREKIYNLRNLKSLYSNLKSQVKEYSFTSCQQAGDYFKNYFIGAKEKEYFTCAFLSTSNKVIAVKNISEGTVDAASIFPREIAKTAILYDSTQIMLSHNHPGGSIRPSNEDIAATKNIVNALAPLKIGVLDHIIVGDNNYMSFMQDNIMPSVGSMVKEKVINQYKDDFPAINNISEKTATFIDNNNYKNGKIISIDELKETYKNYGKLLESNINTDPNIMKEFNELQGVADDLKHASLKAIDNDKKILQIEKVNNIEMMY